MIVPAVLLIALACAGSYALGRIHGYAEGVDDARVIWSEDEHDLPLV